VVTKVEGAPRSTVRAALDRVGFSAAASKLYPPTPGLIPRRALVEDVGRQHGDVVVVTAPAGYGKSTFLAELAAADGRPTAWVSLTGAENHLASFLSYVALALDEFEPVDPACVSALWSGDPTIGSPQLQQFGTMLAARRRSFSLVLDDVHELVSRDVLDVLAYLVSAIPAGSSITVSGRSSIPLPVGRLRVRRHLVEAGPAELAFDEHEALALFAALDVETTPAENAALLARTEGWPVALYLAALAKRDGRTPPTTLDRAFAGDHRYIVEYFGEVLLAQLEPEVATFLMEASCLERLSGPLCDDVLQRTGSAALLEALERRTLLVIPLDAQREWYRFHRLLAEFLRSELTHRNAARHAEIHLRASEWCNVHGDADGAVRHAVHGGDLALAETTVMRWFATVATAGRSTPTTERWLAMFPRHELDQRPQLMVLAAWGCFYRGETGALQWLERAAGSLAERRPEDVHGLVAPVSVAMARMIIAPLSPQEIVSEAEYVHRHVGLDDGHPMACLGLGVAAFMQGEEAEAVKRFQDGAATTLHRSLVVASCVAHLAVIEIEHGRWAEAERLARRARALIGDATSFASTALPLAVSVLVETRAGHAAAVEVDRRVCRQHLNGLVDMAPWLNIQVRVALARDAAIDGRRGDAIVLVDEAVELLATITGAPGVARQLEALRREIATTRDRVHTFGPRSLTTAELRVLRLLPTHLSIAEIADRLYVSRNTVKSQAIAIYRKLGTSSRSGAVEVAIQAGMLGGPGDVG
jgi:LuxR family maltose regulon positive regulatory protein